MPTETTQSLTNNQKTALQAAAQLIVDYSPRGTYVGDIRALAEEAVALLNRQKVLSFQIQEGAPLEELVDVISLAMLPALISNPKLDRPVLKASILDDIPASSLLRS